MNRSLRISLMLLSVAGPARAMIELPPGPPEPPPIGPVLTLVGALVIAAALFHGVGLVLWHMHRRLALKSHFGWGMLGWVALLIISLLMGSEYVFGGGLGQLVLWAVLIAQVIHLRVLLWLWFESDLVAAVDGRWLSIFEWDVLEVLREQETVLTARQIRERLGLSVWGDPGCDRIHEAMRSLLKAKLVTASDEPSSEGVLRRFGLTPAGRIALIPPKRGRDRISAELAPVTE